jgi:hypothetical protein
MHNCNIVLDDGSKSCLYGAKLDRKGQIGVLAEAPFETRPGVWACMAAPIFTTDCYESEYCEASLVDQQLWKDFDIELTSAGKLAIFK